MRSYMPSVPRVYGLGKLSDARYGQLVLGELAFNLELGAGILLGGLELGLGHLISFGVEFIELAISKDAIATSGTTI